jgi:hypothetical protein
MRMLLAILGLMIIALGLVHLRRQEAVARHQIQRLESRHADLRREIWDRQVRMGRLMTPEAVRGRTEAMDLEMTYDIPTWELTPQGRCLNDEE